MRVYLALLMGLLDFGMAISYGRERQWALALVWFAYAVAAVALGTVNQR